MTKATLTARTNRNGKVVAEIKLECGSQMPVPRAGRINDQTFLDHNGEAVNVKRNKDGSVHTITGNGKILFQQGYQQESNSCTEVAQSPGTEQSAAGQGDQQGRDGDDSNTIQTIAQRRAKHALDAITSFTPAPGPSETKEDKKKRLDKQKRFNSYVSSFGPMILMNGFGQACAFYMANNKSDKSERRDALNMLDNWLVGEGRPLAGKRDKNNIVERIIRINAHEYQLAQVEALAYLDWLKKFAKAFLKSEAEDAEEEEDDDVAAA